MNDNACPVSSTIAGNDAAELMFRLMGVSQAVEERLEAALEQVGLSMPKYGLLHLLVQESKPLTLSECSSRMSCVRSNMTQLMDRLEADGLVRRVEDVADRRAVRAAVTPRGHEKHAAGAQQVEKVQTDFANRLAGVDRDALRDALAALA